jgi:hypothetical protein
MKKERKEKKKRKKDDEKEIYQLGDGREMMEKGE